MHVTVFPPRRHGQLSASQRLLCRVAHDPDNSLQIVGAANEVSGQGLRQPGVLARRPGDLELRAEVQVHEVPTLLPRGGGAANDVDKLVVAGGDAAGGVPFRLADRRIVTIPPQKRHDAPLQSGLVRSQARERLHRLGHVSKKHLRVRVRIIGR